jgi:hypothetical protein
MLSLRRHNPLVLAGVLAVALALLWIGAAPAKMKSQRSAGICVTTGGGKFVDIPGFPGEKIDRRLLADVRMLVRRYDIFITDGFSTSSIHSSKGEHPLGLALDIVPNKAAGGTWKKVDRLARWAEPQQDRPRAPFRWVGYDGDSGHGRGHHLHLSWNHGGGSFGKPVRTVNTLRCPGGGKGNGGNNGNGNKKDGDGKNKGTGNGNGGATTKGGKKRPKKGKKPDRNGGIKPGGRRSGQRRGGNGGFSSRHLSVPAKTAPAKKSSRETGGISAP